MVFQPRQLRCQLIQNCSFSCPACLLWHTLSLLRAHIRFRANLPYVSLECGVGSSHDHTCGGVGSSHDHTGWNTVNAWLAVLHLAAATRHRLRHCAHHRLLIFCQVFDVAVSQGCTYIIVQYCCMSSAQHFPDACHVLC